MKKILFLFLLLFTLFACDKPKLYTDTYIIEKDGKFGFIDSLGNELIKPQYLSVARFNNNGIALVVLDTIQVTEIDTVLGIGYSKKMLYVKYGYINTNNEFIFPKPSFACTIIRDNDSSERVLKNFCYNHSFASNGLAVVMDSIKRLNGYINIDGDTIIACRYEEANIFSNKVAVVKKCFEYDSIAKRAKDYSLKFGYIDAAGKEICDFKYSSLSQNCNNRAFASITYTEKVKDDYKIDGELSKDKKTGDVYVDKSKAKTIKLQDNTSPNIGWDSYMVDEKGRIIGDALNQMYSFANFSDEGIAIAIPNRIGDFFGKNYAFLKKNGEFIMPLDGLTKEQIDKIKVDDKTLGVLSNDLKILDATFFHDGYAAVKVSDDAWCYVNKYLIAKGSSNKKAYESAGPFQYGIAPIKIDGKWGYINTKFDIVVPCKYDSCCIAGKKLCKIYNSNGTVKIVSFINKKGNVVWQGTEYSSLLDNKEKNIKSASEFGKWKNIKYDYKAKVPNGVIVLLTVLLVLFCFAIHLFFRNNNKRRRTTNIDKIKLSINKVQKQLVGTNTPMTTINPQLSHIKKNDSTFVSTNTTPHQQACISNTQQHTDNSPIIVSTNPHILELDNSYDKAMSNNIYVNYSAHQELIFSEGFYMSISFPKKRCIIFPYRTHQINRRGFSEQKFEDAIRRESYGIFSVVGNANILLSDGNRPYEPDIAIIYDNKNLDIRIDVEIDEPYSGYTREPIHYIGCGDEFRDKNMMNAGWIVMRFAEEQIVKYPKECIAEIFKLIHLLDNTTNVPSEYAKCESLKKIKRWSDLEAKMMAFDNYRESYLHHTFGNEETELYNEQDIKQNEREKKLASLLDNIEGLNAKQPDNIDGTTTSFPQDSDIKFFAKEHVYIYKDTIRLIPVSDIVSLFFRSFDNMYWSKIKADQNHISQLCQLEQWENKKNKSCEVGTFLHSQIENYYYNITPVLNYNYSYNGHEVTDKEIISISSEWNFFQSFIRENIIKPFRTEWRIFDKELKIAGTIDLICRNGNTFDIYDWKRSDKINTTETPWQYGINGLEKVPDTRYTHYCLQQNLYRYILEKNYNVKIANMYLVVLHPTFQSYKKIIVPKMDSEILLITSYLSNPI